MNMTLSRLDSVFIARIADQAERYQGQLGQSKYGNTLNATTVQM